MRRRQLWGALHQALGNGACNAREEEWRTFYKLDMTVELGSTREGAVEALHRGLGMELDRLLGPPRGRQGALEMGRYVL